MVQTGSPMTPLETARFFIELARDILIVGGIPVVAALAWKAYKERVAALKEQLNVAKALSYDDALKQIEALKILYTERITTLSSEVDQLKAGTEDQDRQIASLEEEISVLTEGQAQLMTLRPPRALDMEAFSAGMHRLLSLLIERQVERNEREHAHRRRSWLARWLRPGREQDGGDGGQ